MPGRGKVSRLEHASLTALDKGPATNAGASSSARPITPIGMNPQCSVAGDDAVSCKLTAEPFGAAADNVAPAVLRQLNTKLAFTP